MDQVATSPSPPATQKRIIGMLSVAMEELPDVPLYYLEDKLCKALHVNSPPSEMLRYRGGWDYIDINMTTVTVFLFIIRNEHTISENPVCL